MVVVLDMSLDPEINSLKLGPGTTKSDRVVASDQPTDPTREQQPNATVVMENHELPLSSEDAGNPHPAGDIDGRRTHAASDLTELLPGSKDWVELVDWVPLKFCTIKGHVRECESIEEPYIEHGKLPRHPMKPPLNFVPLKGQLFFECVSKAYLPLTAKPNAFVQVAPLSFLSQENQSTDLGS